MIQYYKNLVLGISGNWKLLWNNQNTTNTIATSATAIIITTTITVQKKELKTLNHYLRMTLEDILNHKTAYVE